MFSVVESRGARRRRRRRGAGRAARDDGADAAEAAFQPPALVPVHAPPSSSGLPPAAAAAAVAAAAAGHVGGSSFVAGAVAALVALLEARGASLRALVCLGLGSPCGSGRARVQLAALLALRARLAPAAPVHVYDPVLTADDREALRALGCGAPEGPDVRGGVPCGAPVELFFLPHCPLRLYSNVLWANWGRLRGLVVLGNSFAAYACVASAAPRGADPSNCVAALSGVAGVVREARLDAGELYFALNDTSLHSFEDSCAPLPPRPPEYTGDICEADRGLL